MDCIVFFCDAQSATDILITGFYGTAVLVMIASAVRSRSKTIQDCAFLIGGSWLITIVAYFNLNQSATFSAVTLSADIFLAWRFWRMAQRSVFPAGLSVILLGEIAFVVAAKAVALDTYWTAFWLNRIFEITLLYIIGGSLLRLRLLRGEAHGMERAHGRRRHLFEMVAPS